GLVPGIHRATDTSGEMDPGHEARDDSGTWAMSDGISRREILGGIAVTMAASQVQAAPRPARASDPHPALDRTLSRIAFGSCSKQSKDQPIWDAVLEAKPDLFIFLGDNIYADTRDAAVMAEKYQAFAAKPGFKRLRETTPIVAMWDDHD